MVLRGAAWREPALPSAPRRAIPGAAFKLLSDERLARLAAAGDRTAFAVIFDRHRAELYRYCISILRNGEDAADALQNTMLRALNALEGDTREIALRPWLYRIAHNEAVSLIRRRRPTASDGDGMSHAQVDVETSAATRAQLTEVLDDIRELPERQRGALVMREMAGLEYSEIAAALATTPAGAKQAIYEARRALYELAKGREMECEAIQRTLSDGDGRAVRGRAVRAHLRACAGCRDFGATIEARQSKLAALSPAMPAGLAARMLQSILGGGAGGSQAGLISGIAAPAAVKSLSAVALMVATGAGATQVAEHRAGSAARPSVAAQTVSSSAAPASARAGAPVAGRRGPSAELRGESTGAPDARGDRVRRGARDDRLSPAKPGNSRARAPESADNGSGQAAAAPAPATSGRRGLRRDGRSGSGDGEPSPVRDGVSTQLNQVQSQVGEVRDVAGTTVDTVTQALPVQPPKLPLLSGR